MLTDHHDVAVNESHRSNWAARSLAAVAAIAVGVAFLVDPGWGVVLTLNAFVVALLAASFTAKSRRIRRTAIGLLSAMAAVAFCFAAYIAFFLLTWRGM